MREEALDSSRLEVVEVDFSPKTQKSSTRLINFHRSNEFLPSVTSAFRSEEFEENVSQMSG